MNGHIEYMAHSTGQVEKQSLWVFETINYLSQLSSIKTFTSW